MDIRTNLVIIVTIVIIWLFMSFLTILNGDTELKIIKNASIVALTALVALICTNYVLVIK